VVLQPVAHEPVAAEMVHVVVRLKRPCCSTIQVTSGRTYGRMIPAATSGVVVRRELVADVVQQRAEHELLVGAAGFGTRRHLQRMLETSDRIAFERGVELAERVEHAVRQARPRNRAPTGRAGGSPRACRPPSGGS
jgi:hypothetical protein